MPVISPSQFIAIVDRIAAEYDLLMTVDQQVNSPMPNGYYHSGACYPARLLVDLTGTSTHILLKALISGTDGNELSFTIVDPGVPSSILKSVSQGNNLGISLQTDSNGNFITTPEDLVALLNSNSDFDDVYVVYPVTNIGGLVQPYSRTKLSGGVGTASI